MIWLLKNIYSLFLKVKPYEFYYYDDNRIIRVDLIAYMFYFLREFLFDGNLYYVKDNKLKIYNDDSKSKFLPKKIIKNIYYSDDNYKLQLSNLKKDTFNIDEKIPIKLLILKYLNIKVNENSLIHLDFFNASSKKLRINSTTKFCDLFD